MRPQYREEPCKAALNRVQGMPFHWSLNPYMGCVHRCTFCYVRAFERRAERPWGNEYGQSIRVKVNIAKVLSRELSRAAWKRETVAVGTATDPYQPADGRYRLTRACLEALHRWRTPLDIITRGPLVIRDIDVLQSADAGAGASVSMSIPTLDPDIWRTTEPGTAPPLKRLEAIRRLANAGVPVAVALAPIIPGLSDRPAALAEVVRAARDAGAGRLWCRVLNLRPGTREHFLEAIARDWPAQLANVSEPYRYGDYPSPQLEERVSSLIRQSAGEWGLDTQRRRTSQSAADERQLALI